jgi:DNA replication protein DnaC
MENIKKEMEELKITLEETIPENGNSSKGLKADPMQAQIQNLPKRFESIGFKTFQETEDNKANFIFAKYYAKGGTEKKSAVFYGGCGLGKTHLAIAIAKNLRPVMRNRYERDFTFKKPVMYQARAKTNFINADEFFVRCNEVTFNKESKITYVKELLRWELLILDDLSLANMTDAKNENLYLLINTAYLDCRNIIITTNATLQQLKHYDVRIFSRLAEMCHFQEFSGQDWRMR